MLSSDNQTREVTDFWSSVLDVGLTDHQHTLWVFLVVEERHI
jgi:hypothetical protein